MMHVNLIQVSRLHGFINAKVELTNDLAIIVGVNGAGKTSILNLAAHLLRLNLLELAVTSFSRFVVKGRNNKKQVEVVAEKSGRQLTIRLKISGRIYDEWSVRLPSAERLHSSERHQRVTLDRVMRRHYEDLIGTELYAYLRDSARLTLVRLDRTIFAEENDGIVAVEMPAAARFRSSDVDGPIDRVNSVTAEKYNDFRVVSKRLNEELTRKIVVLLFRVPKTSFLHRRSDVRQVKPQQLVVLKEKLLKLPYFTEDQQAADQIKEYFEFAISAVESSDVSQPEQYAARALFKGFEFPRLSGLVDAFANYERQLAGAYSELERFVIQTNNFLVESEKEVFFSDAEASLRFRLKGRPDNDGRPLEELSSGEQQIVTMLTYLAFMAGENSIFVVDEPELSLYLAWQVKLVDALISLRPKGGQLILATHSPEIVGRHRKSVIGLKPSYSSGV